MHTKNNLIVKITSLLLVIFLGFGNIAQVNAAFRGNEMGVDFDHVISVSDPADEEALVEDLAEPTDEAVEPAEESPDAEIFAPDTGWYGDGSATEFYIGTVDELEGLDQLVTGGTTFAGKTIYLTADLDLAGKTFLPIGTKDTNFNGTFNGQNHTISNLNRTLGSSGSHAGLFARIGASGAANRAHFLNLNLTGFYLKAFNYVGGLAGQSVNALVDNVHVVNSEFYGEQYVGGLIGYLNAEIKNSSATSITIDHAGYSWLLNPHYGHKMGGLGGYVIGGSLTAPKVFDNNTATNVSVSGARECGGLFGLVGAHVWVTNSTVTGSYIEARMPSELENRKPWAGGLVGWANGNYSVYAGPEVSNNTVISPMPECQGDIVGGPLENTRFWDVYNTNKYEGKLTLSEAVTAAAAGNTLKVISRKVNETAPTLIDKALTIIGPNVGISAIDGERVSEYRIYGGTTITVNASPVVIDGLSFEGTRFNLLTPTTLRNNIYAPVSGDQYVIVVGSESAGGSDPLTAAYDLSGNAFISNPNKRMIIHLPAEATNEQKTQMNAMFTALHPPIAVAMYVEGTTNPYSYIAGIPPIANNDSYTTPEDETLNVAAPGVLFNDTDVDGDPLTAVLVTGVSVGSLTLNADGSFSYTPVADWNGTVTFTYKAKDATLYSNTATVTITVTAVNDAPVAQDIAVTTTEDTAIDITLIGTDIDGDTLTYSIVGDPTNGTVTLVGNVATYTPIANFNGTGSFTYKVNDGEFDSNTATVTITVTAVNDAPVAQDIDVTTLEDTAVNITLLGTDVDGDTLTYAIVGTPTNGTVTLVGNVATFTPTANFNGTGSFTYKVNDGEFDSNTATVTVTVTPVNDAPVAQDIAVTTLEGYAVDITLIGTDIEGDPLTYAVVAGPTNGAVTIAGNVATYTPTASFSGTDSFTYKANDGNADSDPATVSITVYALPTISSPDLAGPYFVGALGSFSVTMTNPAGGASYTSMSASIEIQNISLDDFTSIEVKNPISGNWITLNAVEQGDNVVINIPATDAFATDPGESWTLNFRGTFKSAGSYDASGVLYCNDSGAPVVIGSLTDTMVVLGASPVIGSTNLSGPYFVGEQGSFTVTMTNPADGGTYTNLSATIVIEDISLQDFTSIEVKHPVSGQWITLNAVEQGDNVVLNIGPTEAFAITPGKTWTLEFQGEFLTPGSYVATGTLYCHDSGEEIAIGSLTDTMRVYARPVISSTDVAGPYFVGEQREFHVTLDNTNGMAYTSLSATIFVADIGEEDYENIEVLRPGTTDQWVTLVPEEVGGGLRLVIGPTSNYPVAAGGSVTLTFRGTFRTAGNYTGTGTLFSHDGATPVAIASLTATMNVYQRPVISSTNLSGPYHVGALGSFSVKMENPANGYSYTSMSAAIEIKNISLDDFTSIEVENPISGNWITLNAVEQGDNVVINIPATSAFATGPGDSWTLNFRGTFKTAGSYDASGVLYCNDSGAPVVIGSLEDTMVVLGASPVIGSANLSGPYFVNEQGSFTVTMTNPANGGTYTNLSATIVIEDISLQDFTSIEVKHPVSGQWITLTPQPDGAGNLVIAIPPTAAFAITPGSTWELDFRGTFLTAGHYDVTGTLYCHDSGEPIVIGSLSDTMDVYARPVISSDDVAGPYFVGEQREFHVTLDNTNGMAYTSLSATIFVADIGEEDYENIEVLRPGTTDQWVTLVPEEVGGGLRLVIGPTSNYPVAAGGSVTLTFRGTFRTAGNYTGTGTLFSHDGATPVAIASLTATMNVYQRPVISSDDVAGPYFVGEQREFHVTLDNTNGIAYTSMSASIFVDHIGLADYESIEVLRPGTTDEWITLTPVVEGDGLRLVIGPTSNYPVAAGGSVTLTFRGTFRTAGNYTGTGTLFSHDGAAPVAIASLTATMNVYQRPVISSDDVAGPYFVGEQREFHVTLDNTNGMAYTSLSATIFVADIGEEDYENIEVLRPGTTDQWVTLVPEEVLGGLRLVIGPTSNYPVAAGGSVTLTFRGTFNTAGNYTGTGTLFSHDGATPVAIASLTATMNVYQRPVISSDDVAGPYFVGEQREFHVTLDNTDGTTYTSMSASIFVDNIGLADFAVAEVKHPVTGQWITLTPVVEGTGLRLVVGPTSNYAVGPDDIVTLTFRVEFNTAGSYPVTGILYCHDSGTAVEIGSLTDTMVVLPPPNKAPVAVDDGYMTAEDTLLTVDAPGILANDTDPEGDALSANLVTDVSHGTMTLNANGSFTYMPETNFNGVDSFTYKVNDGELDSNVATVTITVTAVNDAPVAENIEVTTPEDTAIDITLIGSDVDGDALTYAIVDGPANGTVTIVGNVVTYTPNLDFNGTDSFTYKVNDGELDSNVATVTITVTAVNDAPVAEDITVTTPEDTAIDITLIGSDVDGDTLTYAIEDEPANGTVTIVGNVVTYTPNANFNGTDSFTYKVNDGELDSNVATVTITVTAVNDAPVAEDITVTTPEDTAIDITLIGSDVDGDTLTYAIVDGPANGTVTIVGNVVTYTPNANFNGTDSFTYKVNDGELDSNVATVTITVTPVNDAPIAVDDAYTVAEDTVLTVAAPGVLENDSDVDGDVLNVALRSNVSHGVLVLFSDGSFTYTPDPDFFGTDSFTYDLITYPQPPQPMSGWTDWATVTITVTPVNDAPVLDEIPDFTIPELAPFAFIAAATDVDDTELTFSLTNPPAGAAIDPETGEFTWTPTHDQVGDHDITLCVSDGELEDCQTFKITVTPVNGSPVAVEDEYTLNQDEVLTVDAPGVLENDSDPDDDPLTARLVTTTQHGTLILGGDGSFMYIPDAGYFGEDTFTYKAFDGKYYSEEVTVTLIVVKKPVLNLYFPIIKK